MSKRRLYRSRIFGMRPLVVGSFLLFAPMLMAQVTVGPERQLTVPEFRPAAGQGATTASNGSDWVVVWSNGGFKGGFLDATRVDSRGQVIDRSPIVIAAGDVPNASVAFGVDHYLIAWGTSQDVRVRMLAPDGTLSPTVQVASLAPTPFANGVAQIQAVWNGTRFFVTWTSFSQPQAWAILDARGVLIKSGSLETHASEKFTLAGGIDEFAIFYSSFDLTATGTNGASTLSAVRISDSGQLTGPFTIDHSPDRFLFFFRPRAAFNGRDYLVVWSSFADNSPVQDKGARLAMDGTVLLVPPFSSGTDRVDTLTWTGSEFIESLSDGQHIDAISLNADGAPSSALKSVFEASAPQSTQSSSAAWNGQDLLVPVEKGAVFAKFLDASATPIDPSFSGSVDLTDRSHAGRPVALSPASQTQPSVASVGGGESLVTWLEYRPDTQSIEAMVISLRDGLSDTGHPARSLGPVAPPMIASDGTQYLLVWNTVQGGLVGQRLDRQGSPIDPQPFLISSTASINRPTVTFDGVNFVVASESGNGCFHSASFNPVVNRVSRSGVILDPVNTPIPARTCGGLSLTSGSDGSLLTWNGRDGTGAAFITKGGATAGPTRLRRQPPLKRSGPATSSSWQESGAVLTEWESNG